MTILSRMAGISATLTPVVWTYPVVMIYPTIGDSFDALGFLQESEMDREVNRVTSGRPGGSGSSETKKENT